MRIPCRWMLVLLRRGALHDGHEDVGRNRLPQRAKYAGGRVPVGPRHDDDRNRARRGVRDDFLVDVDAAYPRQVEIQHDNVRNTVLVDGAQRGQAVVGHGHVEARDAQRVLEQLARGAVVLDEQNRGSDGRVQGSGRIGEGMTS